MKCVEGACDSGGSQEEPKQEQQLCIWHACRNPRVKSDPVGDAFADALEKQAMRAGVTLLQRPASGYCETHTKLVAIERAELEAAMKAVSEKRATKAVSEKCPNCGAPTDGQFYKPGP